MKLLNHGLFNLGEIITLTIKWRGKKVFYHACPNSNNYPPPPHFRMLVITSQNARQAKNLRMSGYAVRMLEGVNIRSGSMFIAWVQNI